MIKRINVAVLMLTLIGATSCDQDNDPVVTQSNDVLLTAHTWKVSEIRSQQSNSAYYYKRGVSGSTIDLDDERIKFNSGGTGVYTGTDGADKALTWSFTNPEKTKLQWTATLIGTTPTTVNW